MADDIDLSSERAEADLARRVEATRQAAAGIPPGIAGDCDLCGEHSMRLVGGACAPCRDKHQLP